MPQHTGPTRLQHLTDPQARDLADRHFAGRSADHAVVAAVIWATDEQLRDGPTPAVDPLPRRVLDSGAALGRGHRYFGADPDRVARADLACRCGCRRKNPPPGRETQSEGHWRARESGPALPWAATGGRASKVRRPAIRAPQRRNGPAGGRESDAPDRAAGARSSESPTMTARFTPAGGQVSRIPRAVGRPPMKCRAFARVGKHLAFQPVPPR